MGWSPIDWDGESHTRVDGLVLHQRCTEWCGKRYTRGGWAGTTSKVHRVVWREPHKRWMGWYSQVYQVVWREVHNRWMDWYYIKDAQSGVERGKRGGWTGTHRCTEWCGERYTRGGWAGTHRCTEWCGERYPRGGWAGTTSKVHKVVWREVHKRWMGWYLLYCIVMELSLFQRIQLCNVNVRDVKQDRARV